MSEEATTKALEAVAEGFETLAKRLREIAAASRGLKEAARLEDVEDWFPRELRSLLTFEQAAESVIIKPRSFLGSEAFGKIAAIVRDHKGEYVSAGKESHFKLPR